MPFPKAGPGLRAKIDGELWSAGSAEWQGSNPRRYLGVLRVLGGARWSCYHRHETSAEARQCAAAELAQRRT